MAENQEEQGAEVKDLWSSIDGNPDFKGYEQEEESEQKEEKQEEDNSNSEQEEQKEEQQSSSESQEEQKEEKEVFDPKAWLAEQTGGKYEALEDLLAAAEKKPTLDLDAEQEKIYQYIKEGKETELSEYLTMKNTDFKALEPDYLLKLYLEDNKPHLNEDDVNDLLVDKYGFGKEPLSEEDKALMSKGEIDAYEKELRANALARKEAIAEAVSYFEKQKSELTLPDLPKQEIEGFDEFQRWKDEIAQDEVQAEKAQAEWTQGVDQTVPTIKELTFNSEIETSIGRVALDTKFQLTDAQQDQVKEYLKGYMGGTKYDEEKYVREGRVDFQGLTQSAIERLFSKEIREAQLKEFAAKYEELALKDLKRFDGGIKDTSEPYVAGKSAQEDLFDRIPNFN